MSAAWPSPQQVPAGRSVEGAVSVSMADSAAGARTVETTAAANATVPFPMPKYSRGMSIAKSAPTAAIDSSQARRSGREQQQRIRRQCRDQSVPVMRRRRETKKMMMMTSPPRLGSSLTVLPWWWMTTRPQSRTATTSLHKKQQHRSRVHQGARWKRSSSLSLVSRPRRGECSERANSSSLFYYCTPRPAARGFVTPQHPP